MDFVDFFDYLYKQYNKDVPGGGRDVARFIDFARERMKTNGVAMMTNDAGGAYVVLRDGNRLLISPEPSMETLDGPVIQCTPSMGPSYRMDQGSLDIFAQKGPNG